MNYLQFLSILLAARDNLPQLLDALENLYTAYLAFQKIVQLIFLGGQPVAMPLSLSQAVSDVEMDCEEQILARINPTAAVPAAPAS